MWELIPTQVHCTVQWWLGYCRDGKPHGERMQRRRAEAAEQRVLDQPRTLPKTKHLEMWQAYASSHRDLEDGVTPALSFLDSTLEQVEDAALKVDTLKEIVAIKDAGDAGYHVARNTPDGTLKLKRGRATGKTPQGPEELRTKLKLLGTMWDVLRLCCPGRAYLADGTHHNLGDYADWQLGPDVYKFEVRATSGSDTHRVQWSTLLELDAQARTKHMTLSM